MQNPGRRSAGFKVPRSRSVARNIEFSSDRSLQQQLSLCVHRQFQLLRRTTVCPFNKGKEKKILLFFFFFWFNLSRYARHSVGTIFHHPLLLSLGKDQKATVLGLILPVNPLLMAPLMRQRGIEPRDDDGEKQQSQEPGHYYPAACTSSTPGPCRLNIYIKLIVFQNDIEGAVVMATGPTMSRNSLSSFFYPTTPVVAHR